ncbi:MAG: hypothetical protein P4L99_01930 [Chthoniobacter sp.]|nr:hypothetical protein [Chthoniobacter sp.]
MLYNGGMSTTKRIFGGVAAVVGYLLSPLSWWNDLFINIPLAYLFAFLVGLVLHGYFLPSMIVGYWITNVAGFVIMHAGIKMASSKEVKIEYLKDFLISLGYTALVIVFYHFGWLKFPTE